MGPVRGVKFEQQEIYHAKKSYELSLKQVRKSKAGNQ
jgi:hypothetical protein